ncbi:retrovirus-related pol polyprotein from transposon TNT 1-94 [Tanacetum coccineum]
MSQDVMLTVMDSTAVFGNYENLETKKSETCNKCLDLEAELVKRKNMVEQGVYTELQTDKSCENQNAQEFSEYFDNNDLKAHLQEKDTAINKLRNHIRSLREFDKKDRVKQDMDEIETINIELEHSVAKLLSENELLHKEIEHLKKIYKDQFDSIKKTRALSKEHRDSLIAQLNSKSMENADLKGQIQEKVFVTTTLQNELRRLKGKNVLDNATTITNATTIAPGMFKLDLEPLSPKLLNNREAHIHYLKTTKEQADILRGIVEQARAKQPLDSALDFACKHVTRIQELLVYVRDTCPSVNNSSEKLIDVTPLNKNKKVRFVEPVILQSNTKPQVGSHNTPDSSACRSQPSGNTKNNRILRPTSSNIKNKVKDHHMSCMFDAIHDMCVLDFVKDVNVRSKSKSAKSNKKHNIWKPTDKVFTEIGYRWKPTGRTFTLVGNSCPLTRITSTKVVHLKKTTSKSLETQKLEIKVNSRDLMLQMFHLLLLMSISGCPDRSLVSDSGCSKHMTGNRSQLINFVSKFMGTVRFGNDQIAKIMGYGDYQLGNITISRVYYVEALGLEKGRYGVSKGFDTAYWRFLGVGTTYRYDVSSLMDTTYWMSESVFFIFLRLSSRMRYFHRINDAIKVTLFDVIRISHQTSIARTPQQNGVVERRNQTLVEAARTMLIFSKAPLFLWAEAVATTCYTQNRSLIRKHHNKTPYELLHNKKPDLSYLHVFGALCYPTNDSKDLGKLQPKVDIGIFVVYAPAKEATRASTNDSWNTQFRTRAKSSFSTPYVPPINNDWDILFQPMFDELLNPPPSVVSLVPAAQRPANPTGSPVSTSIDQDASSSSNPSTQEQEQSLIISQDSTSQGSSSNVRPSHTLLDLLSKWTKNHPLANVIRDPSRSVSTRKKLNTDAMWRYFDAFLTSVKPKNFKEAMLESS